MIWQLAKEVWWYESRFPLNAVGYALEPIYLRVYRRTPVFTYSASTAADLRALGFSGKVTIVPVGIDPVNEIPLPKSLEPSFVYVGRLAPSKRVDDIIRAFALFRQADSRGRLLLIGDGPKVYVNLLTALVKQLGIADSVEFCGWLDGAAKHRRMSEATALLMASAREGWGLVVTECNACGTPAVVYDVPGLRDSVRHMQTGLVVSTTPRSMADGMLQLVRDQDFYERLRAEGQRWSRTFTYEQGTRIVLETIEGSVAHKKVEVP
jgi:glycosyltransferase involved in cell wall biosynthesis